MRSYTCTRQSLCRLTVRASGAAALRRVYCFAFLTAAPPRPWQLASGQWRPAVWPVHGHVYRCTDDGDVDDGDDNNGKKRNDGNHSTGEDTDAPLFTPFADASSCSTCERRSAICTLRSALSSACCRHIHRHVYRHVHRHLSGHVHAYIY